MNYNEAIDLDRLVDLIVKHNTCHNCIFKECIVPEHEDADDCCGCNDFVRDYFDDLDDVQTCQTRIIFQNNNCKSVTQKVITKGDVYIDEDGEVHPR